MEKFYFSTRSKKKIIQSVLVVSHAGIGSIMTALEYKKPIIIIPRRARLQEHRNDHQVYTAEKFKDININGVYIAMNENELYNLLDQRENLIYNNNKFSQQQIQSINPLIHRIKEFIND